MENIEYQSTITDWINTKIYWKLIENYVTNYSLFVLNHLKIQSILD